MGEKQKTEKKGRRRGSRSSGLSIPGAKWREGTLLDRVGAKPKEETHRQHFYLTTLVSGTSHAIFCGLCRRF
jgi:hypothetical protein